MPRQPRQLADSGIHHVMLRGVNRQDVFLDEDDRRCFLQCLDAAKELSGCSVLAYCLMTNHVHLVIQVRSEPIGQVIKRLGVRYVYWHNLKHNRVGHLFQDRFKSRPVDDDSYLVTLLRYVWNNPVKAGLVSHPEHYRWSSLRPNPIVDQVALRGLVEPDVLAQLATVPVVDAEDPGWRPSAMRDSEAAELVAQLYSELGRWPDFGRSRSEQRRVFLDALVRGMSVRQLARVAQLDRKTIQRLIDSEGPAGTVPGGPGTVPGGPGTVPGGPGQRTTRALPSQIDQTAASSAGEA